MTAATGIISTVAGDGTAGYGGDAGAATGAELSSPFGVAVDGAGNLYIADHYNNRIRKVSAATSVITTVAGNGTGGYNEDGVAATSAELYYPVGAAGDGAGNLYIGDTDNFRIREVSVSTPPTLTFPTPTAVGELDATDDPLGFTVENIGNQPLVFAAPDSGMNPSVASGFLWDNVSSCTQAASGGNTVSLAAAASCTVAIDFEPSGPGTNSGTVTLTDNNLNVTGAQQSVGLSGTGLAVDVQITIATSPSGLLVSGGGAPSAAPLVESWAINSQQTISTSTPQAGTTGVQYAFSGWSDGGLISHTIAVPSAATTYTASFTTQYQLTVTAGTGGTIAAGTAANGYYNSGSVLALVATPAAGYAFSGWTGANIQTPTSASTTVTLNAPEAITANFVSVPVASISPTGINLGTLYLGSIVTKTVTVKNTGTAAMSISNPLIAIVKGGNSSEFATVNLCPKSLAAGKSWTMTVTFVAGPFYTPQTADLMISDNAAGSPQAVPLTATVIDPVPGFNPISLSFGTEKTKSTSKPKTITVTSVGGTELSVSKVSVTGTDKGDFIESDNCAGKSFNPKATCTVNITFTPGAKGLRTATLVVTDNALINSQSIPLAGTGD